MPFLLFLILWPFAEIVTFIQVGQEIGVLRTIALVVAAIVAGGLVIQFQGMKTFVEMQAALRRGTFPAREMFDAFTLYMAGILLIVPGFCSDIVALGLLVPPVRHGLQRQAERYFHTGSGGTTWDEEQGDIVDAEYSHVEEDENQESEIYIRRITKTGPDT